MKTLVLGGSGMLGRALVRELGKHHQVLATLRGSAAQCATRDPLLTRIVGEIDALVPASIADLLNSLRPAAVIHTIGIVPEA